MSEFDPKTAVITGGASGIGLATAKALIQRGVKVMIADLPSEKLEDAARDIGAAQHPLDVREEAQWEALAQAAFEQLGSVELFFNNAGVGGPHGKLWEVDVSEARAHFDVNFWGMWNGIRAFAPRMIAQDTPSAIYNTASENSLFCAVPRTAAYIAAKHGVLGMTESLAEDLPAHVHAGTVIPGWVFTGIGEDRFMQHGMETQEYAAIIVPQMLERARFVVSHTSNLAHIDERTDALHAAYAANAFDDTADGAPDYDVRNFIARMQAQRR